MNAAAVVFVDEGRGPACVVTAPQPGLAQPFRVSGLLDIRRLFKRFHAVYYGHRPQELDPHANRLPGP